MEKGTRVGAIRNAKDETVYLYGFGTYQGDELHPAIGIPNPKILLDNGSVVWGCECWWGSEEKVTEMIGDRKIEFVSIGD